MTDSVTQLDLRDSQITKFNSFAIQDLDQLFGQASTFLRHHLRFAETIDNISDCLQKFLQRVDRPHEPLKIVRRLDTVRDWKTHLQLLNRHLRGIGGPRAPKVFEFVQLKGLLLEVCSLFSG